MATIHPTAIIHPGAHIGADCHIGPYCIIGEHVALGEGCRLHSHVIVDGHTQLGRANELYPFASVGLKTQDLKWDGGVTWTKIGEHNVIREHVSIHSATRDGDATILGSHNTILAGSHVGHDVIMGNHVIISMAALGGHVTVEDHALVGGLSAVHQFCRIGRMAMIAGCAKVVQDIPPFMIADGNPAEIRTVNKIGMERNGISEEAQLALRATYKILFRERLTTPNALAQIEKDFPAIPEVQQLVAFVRASERGISKSSGAGGRS